MLYQRKLFFRNDARTTTNKHKMKQHECCYHGNNTLDNHEGQNINQRHLKTTVNQGCVDFSCLKKFSQGYKKSKKE